MTTAADDFLLEFHARHPGCTSQIFADARTSAGDSSYDALASVVDGVAAGPGSGPLRILDLGCGDGYLLHRLAARLGAVGRWDAWIGGVDISPHELALARRRPELERFGLVRARAQQLPVPDGSMDVVLSHLAFMLMSDLDAVVAEIARVLRPGGTFATITGGGPRAGHALDLFLSEFQPVYDQGAPIPSLGDRRMRTDAGIRGLFGPERGFIEPVAIDDFYLDLGGDFARVWASLAVIYEMHALSGADRERVRARFAERVAAITRPDGTIPNDMAMRLIHCQRR